MHKIKWLILGLSLFLSAYANAGNLPAVTGLALNGDQFSWDAQEGASGYNIYLDSFYYTTVRDQTRYTVTEPGSYGVISFNSSGEYGVAAQSVEYTKISGKISYQFNGRTVAVTNTCKDVDAGKSCIAACPAKASNSTQTGRFDYLSGGACSTSGINGTDSTITADSYRCKVPVYTEEVVAQAICVTKN